MSNAGSVNMAPFVVDMWSSFVQKMVLHLHDASLEEQVQPSGVRQAHLAVVVLCRQW